MYRISAFRPAPGFELQRQRSLAAVQGHGSSKPVLPLAAYYAWIAAALIIFCGAWYYPQSGIIGASDLVQVPYAAPFRYLFWGVSVLIYLLHAGKSGPMSFIAQLGPLLLVPIIGIVSAIAGIDFSSSLRGLSFQFIMLLVASIAATSLSNQQITRIVIGTMLAVSVASALVSILLPSIGVQGFADRLSWRGIFSGKQHLGIAVSYTLLFLIVCRRDIPRLVFIGGALVSVICLAGANSVGSVLLVVAGALLAATVRYWVRQKKDAPTGMLMLASAAIFSCVAVYYVMPAIAGYLGRDPTLTGRTAIWSAYLDQAERHLILGTGPGSFTTPSTITLNLSGYFDKSLGVILQPHNTYIAVLGEAGIPGLLCLVLLLAYLIVAVPFVYRNTSAVLCSISAYFVMLLGTTESIPVFDYSLEWFLVTIFYISAIKSGKAGAKRQDLGDHQTRLRMIRPQAALPAHVLAAIFSRAPSRPAEHAELQHGPDRRDV